MGTVRDVTSKNSSVFFPSLSQENRQEDSRYLHPHQPLKIAVQPTVLAAHKAPPVPAVAQPNPGVGCKSKEQHRRAEVHMELFEVICSGRTGLDSLAGISFEVSPPFLWINMVLEPLAAS